MRLTHDGLSLELNTSDLPMSPTKIEPGERFRLKIKTRPTSPSDRVEIVYSIDFGEIVGSVSASLEDSIPEEGAKIWSAELPSLEDGQTLDLRPTFYSEGRRTPSVSKGRSFFPVRVFSAAPIADVDAPRGDIPLGTVVAFAGDNLSDEAKRRGWMLCDGAELDRREYPELFDLIGTLHGTGESSTFHLPDCRGRFIRHQDGGVGLDPDAADRTAPQGTGAKGDQVGSLQADEFESHTHPIHGNGRRLKGAIGPLLITRERGDESRKTTEKNLKIIEDDEDPEEFEPEETRPINVALSFIIKTRRESDPGVETIAARVSTSRSDFPVPRGEVPIGTLASYAGGLRSDPFAREGWIDCRPNRSADSKAPDNELLYQVIDRAFGGDANPLFFIPNLNGRFVRGQDDGAERDPDRDDRDSLVSGGNAGNRIGSVQGHRIESHDHAWGGWNVRGGASAAKERFRLSRENTSDPEDDPLDYTGGNETRPKNISMSALIKRNHADFANAEPQRAPIGSVWMFGGARMPSIERWLEEQGWLFCDGRELSRELYPALGAEIGEVLRIDDSRFMLPDLRGFFVRGSSGDSGLDPGADQRRSPVDPEEIVGDRIGSVQVGTVKSHVHTWYGMFRNGAGGANRAVPLDVNSEDSTRPFGGEETRPVNIYLHYIVKAEHFRRP